MLSFKVIVIGEENSDKTDICSHSTQSAFVEDYKLTIGTSVFAYRREIDGRDVTLQLWDFGEQEQFRSCLVRFTKGARGAVLAFDGTDIESFLALHRVWIPFLRETLPTIPVMLISTKCDQVSLVPDALIEDLMASSEIQFCGYCPTSARNGTNINELFETLARAILGDRISLFAQAINGRNPTIRYLKELFCPLCGVNGIYHIENKAIFRETYVCHQCKNTI
ncbi:MAG: Rab family GTPase [Candidatus Hodarchaeota archaeon]